MGEQRLSSTIAKRAYELGERLVTSSAGILLHHHRQGMRHHLNEHSCTHVATHAAAYATTHPAAHTAACASRASRSVQLRGGCREHLGSRQEGVVLPHPPPWMPTHGAAALRASVAASDANSTSPSR